MGYKRNDHYILFTRSGKVGTVGEISKYIFLLFAEMVDKLDELCKELNPLYVNDIEKGNYHSNYYFLHPSIKKAHALTKSECSKKFAWNLPMTPEAAVCECW